MTTLPPALACRDRMARIMRCGWALALAVLATAALPERASAQKAIFTTTKVLCSGSPSTPGGGGPYDPTTCQKAQTVAANPQPVFYVIQVTNPYGQPQQTITVNDSGAPSGFSPPYAVSCTYPSGTAALPAPNLNTSSFPTTFSFILPPAPTPAGLTVTCTITGTFSQSVVNQQQPNSATVSNDSGLSLAPTSNTSVVANNPLGTTLVVTKMAAPSSVGPVLPATVTYTITIKNEGPNTLTPANFGQYFQLHDAIALLPNSVPLQIKSSSLTFQCSSSGADCLNPLGPAKTGGGFVGTTPTVLFDDWGFASGMGKMSPGGVIRLTVSFLVDNNPSIYCVPSATSPPGGLANTAFLTLTGPPATGSAASDSSTSINTASANVTVLTPYKYVAAGCGNVQLAMTKTQVTPTPPAPVPWGSTVYYDITITNNIASSAQTITISNVQDFVAQGAGTPPFAITAITPPGIPGVATTIPINYTTYGQSQLTWQSSNSVTLGPGQSTTIQIAFQYSNPECTTVPNVNSEPIINTAVITYTATPVGQSTGSQTYQQSASAETNMVEQPTCPFEVSKTLKPLPPVQFGTPTVQFGVPLVYTVNFTNSGTTAATVGTVMDAVRITDSAYGTPLLIAGSWTCSGVTVSPQSGPIGGSAINTFLPTQGARIFTFPNVAFPPGATLTCQITIIVSQPSLNNTNCSATPAYFENLGLMDITNPYNPDPNMPWPPSLSTYTTGGSSPPPKESTNWATVDAPLPQCYDVILNKTASVTNASGNSVSPAWTWQGGPSVNYTVTVTNTGSSGTLTGSFASMQNAWNGLLLTDTFAAPYNQNVVTGASCSPASSCTPLMPPTGSTPYKPSTAGVSNLPAAPANNIGNWNFTLNGPFSQSTPPSSLPGYTCPTGFICNCATVTPSLMFAGPGWYANYANYSATKPPPTPSPPSPQAACTQVPVLATATLDVIKTVVNNTGQPIGLPQTTFTGGVNCGQYALLTSGNWTQTVGGTLVASLISPTAAVIQNVPVAAGENCSVFETTPLPPPLAVPVAACPSGLASWGSPTITWGSPPPPTPSTPQPVPIQTAGATYTVTVTNPLNCAPPATLNVIKTVAQDGDATMIFPATTFPVTVTCPSLSSNLDLKVASGTLQPGDSLSLPPPPKVLSSPTSQVTVAVGETCTVTETPLLTVPPISCHGKTAYWTTTITPPQPMTISAGTNTVTVANTMECALSVMKSVPSDPAGVASSTQFLITATCTPPSAGTPYPVYVYGNSTQAITGPAYGASCTFLETRPPNFTNKNGQTCTWNTPTYSPQPLTIGSWSSFQNSEEVTNSYKCQ